MNGIGIVGAIKEYNKYKKKHIAVAGIIINIILWSIVLFTVITFAVSGLVQNNFFGIMLGCIFSFYLILNILDVVKKTVDGKIEKAKLKYNKMLKLKRLYALSENEFTELAIRCIMKRNKDVFPLKRELFYMSGDTAIVFLSIPEKKDIHISKLNMALKSGADNLIAVTREGTTEKIRNAFGDKVVDIVTDADIVNSAPELDYEEINEKKKFQINKILSRPLGNKFIKMSLGCILPMMIPGLRKYFLGLAIVLFSVGAFILIINKKLNE